MNMEYVNLLSLNVRGLSNKQKRLQVFTWLKKQDKSIYMLQETHLLGQNIDRIKQEWNGKCFLSGKNSNSEGVAFLLNPNSNIQTINVVELIPGRLITLEIKVNKRDYTIINIYGPNKDDPTLFNILNNYIEQNNEKDIIIGGDFNTVIEPTLDKKNGKQITHKKCRNILNEIMNKYSLKDPWRCKNPDKLKYTWHSNTKPHIHCRLDYFLISDNLINNVKKCIIQPAFKTDHSAVYLELNSDLIKHGPGYFKMNNTILLDEEYKNCIIESINNIVEVNLGCNPNTLWEVIKSTIRNETIKYSSFKNKQNKKDELQLINQIKELESQLNGINPDTDTITEHIDEAISKLETINEQKINGFLLRAKAVHVENNEKNSKYFANLEKQRAEKKTIYKLIDKNNIEIYDQTNIMSHIHQFYKKLYSKNTIDSSKVEENLNMFISDNLNKITEEERLSCEGKLTEYECQLALNTMNNNKSPGSDGITAEFYKMFWSTISQYYLDSINYSFENGHLTQLQKQSIITLIPKPGKNEEQLGNWRPLSLLNIDYKIATKVISNRLQKILPSIISFDQSGFMKNRYIGENVRLIFDIIDYANEKNIPGLIFFADFEKAFDSLNHCYLFKCLKKFNFGNELIKWVKLFYNDISSVIINNGYMSESVMIEKGVRQGCPLSTTLFIICIETLSSYINHENNIKGINVKGQEVKQTYFADDGTFFINGSKESFEELVKTFEYYSSVSGLKLNTSKSTILRVGSLKNTITKFCASMNFNWTSSNATTLGMTFHNDKQLNISKNLEKKISEFHLCLKQWQHRKLTLLGKVTVIKTFALPKLIYPFTVLPNPSTKIIADINKSIYNFIWNGKPDKIKRNILKQNYENGGIKLTDIEAFLTSIKTSWVKRYLDKENKGKWKYFFDQQLTIVGQELLFESNLDEKDVKSFLKQGTFLYDVLVSWCKLNAIHCKNDSNIGKQVIWNNSNIKLKGKPLFYLKWLEKGIKNIEHIYDYRTHKFLTFENIMLIFNVSSNDFLKYYSLLDSIPLRYVELLKQENIIYKDDKLVCMVKQKQKINKTLYTMQLKPYIEIKAQCKWKENLNLEQDICWKNIYIIPWKTTTDTALRCFKYKLLNRIIPTNKYLFKCKLNSSNLCDFCVSHIETIEHLFWECPTIQHIWSQLLTYLSTKSIHIQLTKQIALLGYFDNNKYSNVINNILIIMKYFIFAMKCRTRKPNFAAFKNHLTMRIKIEAEIGLQNDKIETHFEKWRNFYRD